MAAVSNHNGFFPLSALQPDQRRHSAGRAVSPEREETPRVGEGAKVAAARPADAGPGQAPAREAAEIREPATGRRRREAAGRTRVIGDEDLAHLLADLEGQGSNGRPEPGEKVGRRPRRPRDGLLQHPGRETAPACVGRGDPVTASVAEQDRQTVGGQDGADGATPARGRGIGSAGLTLAGPGIGHVAPVHLVQPERFGGQRERRAQSLTVLGDVRRIVPHVLGQVQAVPGPTAHAARARRDRRAYRRRCGPVRVEALDHRKFFTIETQSHRESRKNNTLQLGGYAPDG